VRRALLVWALLAAAVGARAEVSFTATVDKTRVAMDDAVVLTVTLSGESVDDARPALPDIPGFRAASAGQSQNFSFINGQAFREVSFTYVLQPEAPGAYTVPALTVRAGGKSYSTAPIAIEVVAAGAAAPAAPREGGRAPPAARGRELFLTAAVDKQEAFVGQAVVLTVRFYSRARLLSQPAYAPPDTTGFLTEDLPPQRQYVEVVDGRRYAVVELRTALFPAAPGTARVGPAALECRTEDFGGMDDPFGSSFFSQFFSGGRPVTIKSEPLSVRVKPLPAEGRPADFHGDVGRYRLSAALDRPRAAVHEPVTLTVTVSGEGNVKALGQPALPPLDGFKAYETLSSLNVAKAGGKVEGSKVFQTVLKPEVSGALRVPPLSFSFFDPEARAYKTVRSQPLSLEVTGAAAVPGSAAAGEGVKVLSRELRYLKSGPPIRDRRPFHESQLFVGLNLLPGLAFLLLFAARAWRSRPAAPDAAARGAAARARRALKAAAALSERDPAAALAAVESLWRSYLADKASTPPAGLTGEDADGILAARGAPEDLRRRAAALWDGLQQSRFAPGSVDAAEARARAQAVEKAVTDVEALR
jgi:hypothetical protein